MCSRWSILFGLALIIIGLLLLSYEIFDVGYELGEFVEDFWPVAIILVGLYLIWRHRSWSGRGGWGYRNKALGDLDIGGDIEPDGLDADLGVGDLRIDLTQARFAQKEHKVRARTGIGDIRIVLPPAIPVHARGASGVGHVQLFDKGGGGLGNQVTFASPDYAAAVCKVSLEVSTGVGDITVTRV